MTRTLRTTPDWLRAQTDGDLVEVDRKNNVIRGYVVAQEGAFKSEGRGEFDPHSLREIVRLMKAAPNGLKSRFGHPTLSDDGLAKFLGRSRNPRLGTATVRTEDGSRKTVQAVRADLHLDPTSFHTPAGNLGRYVLDRAESDPDSFSTSLVLRSDKEYRLEKNGKPKRDTNGNELPPLWRPTALHASDVVDTGDAVDGFLSADGMAGLPDGVVRRATALLDRQFAGQEPEVIRARCLAWLGRYLNWKFGPEIPTRPEVPTRPDDPDGTKQRARLRLNRRRGRFLTERVVQGLAVPYHNIELARIPGEGLEWFEPGSLRLAPVVTLHVDHEPAVLASTGDGTLQLFETRRGIEFEAVLAPHVSHRLLLWWYQPERIQGCSFEFFGLPTAGSSPHARTESRLHFGADLLRYVGAELRHISIQVKKPAAYKKTFCRCFTRQRLKEFAVG